MTHASMDANSPLTPESAQQRGGASSSSASGPRRSHQKSRLGCRTCKSRKIKASAPFIFLQVIISADTGIDLLIKCDEQKPACGNCIRHHVNCDFIETSAVPSHPSSTSFPDLNTDHLELLHNYTTSTYATLSESPIIRDFYRITVVQVGLECDYVMRSLLAVSSLQLAYYRPHMREHYRSMAVHHHEIASRIAGPYRIVQSLSRNMMVVLTRLSR